MHLFLHIVACLLGLVGGLLLVGGVIFAVSMVNDGEDVAGAMAPMGCGASIVGAGLIAAAAAIWRYS
jgi:hypothetical protein